MKKDYIITNSSLFNGNKKLIKLLTTSCIKNLCLVYLCIGGCYANSKQ